MVARAPAIDGNFQMVSAAEQGAHLARGGLGVRSHYASDEVACSGDLDRSAADNVLELLTILAKDRGTTILMVTHDPRAADRADRQLHLDKGVLVDAPSAAVPELHR